MENELANCLVKNSNNTEKKKENSRYGKIVNLSAAHSQTMHVYLLDVSANIFWLTFFIRFSRNDREFVSSSPYPRLNPSHFELTEREFRFEIKCRAHSRSKLDWPRIQIRLMLTDVLLQLIRLTRL